VYVTPLRVSARVGEKKAKTTENAPICRTEQQGKTAPIFILKEKITRSYNTAPENTLF